jgi:two-component system chemotaxis response regulator CheY
MAKILVVEDNENIRSVVRMALEIDKHEVVEADNGKRGWELFQQHPDCALIITDLAMPVMDGHELIRRIRTELDQAEVPVFVLSAERDATGALEDGATRVIRKPFSPIDLLEAVRRVIQP